MFKKAYAKIVALSTAGTAVLALPVIAFAQAVSLPASGGQFGFPNIASAIQSVMNLVFFFALILVLIYLVWGGIQWITSGGDKAGTEAARGKITGAIVGIIIVAVAFAIYTVMLTFVGATDSVFTLRETVANP
jgi:uncharacterized membrane protein YtjA (UPF0391 family)